MPLMNADALNEVNHFLHVFQALLLGEKSQRQYSVKL